MNQINIQNILQNALNHINQNQLDNAYQLLLQADKLSPNNIEVYHLLSVVFGMSGNYEKSELYCKKALEINNTATLIYNNMGTSQKLQGKYDDAIDTFQTAIRINKKYLDPYINLSNLYIEIEKLKEAETLINTAMQIDSSNLALNLALGNLRLKQEEYDKATEIYENIIDSQPQNTDALINLGQIYEHLGDTSKALQYYQNILSIIPGYEPSILGIASILEKQSKFEEALATISPFIEQSQNIRLHIVAARIYSRLNNYKKSEQILLNAKNMYAIDQYKQELLYELGNVLDKQQKYDEAFSAYQQANAINKETFNRKSITDSFNKLIQTYKKEKITQLASSSNKDSTPVFIVGMPRSGTSLVEQILASHSQFFGAGELEYIDNIIYELASDKGNTEYSQWIENVPASMLQDKARQYIDNIRKLSLDAKYISNKMPHNFLHLGMIQQLFPNARIIHCTRTPHDTVLSIYFHQFNKNHPYASDLDDLYFYYQQYEKLMTHWQENLSLSILTINYEELIDNPEYKSKQLIDFMELEWQEDCLNFHENKRMVNTPSYHQVRQPLYRTAINRHQHYKKYLRPF